jgi:NAD-dependent oxidoreductase involved in siderophore biosynthesis
MNPGDANSLQPSASEKGARGDIDTFPPRTPARLQRLSFAERRFFARTITPSALGRLGFLNLIFRAIKIRP